MITGSSHEFSKSTHSAIVLRSPRNHSFYTIQNTNLPSFWFDIIEKKIQALPTPSLDGSEFIVSHNNVYAV